MADANDQLGRRGDDPLIDALLERQARADEDLATLRYVFAKQRDAGLPEPRTQDASEDDLNRRGFLRASAALGLEALGNGLGVRDGWRSTPPMAMESADVSASVSDLDSAVARLRCMYPRVPPSAVVPEVRGRLDHAEALLIAGIAPAYRRDLMATTGWLTLLLATAHFDLNQPAVAWTYRRRAERIGHEMGMPDLTAWAIETGAYFALHGGRFREAINYARAAQNAAAPDSSVALASRLQEATCWSRLGVSENVKAAIASASDVFDHLQQPTFVGDHYSFDPAKFDFFVATAYAEIGMASEAEHLARSTIRTCMHRPHTVGNARMTLAVSLAQRQNHDEAAHEASLAISSPSVHVDTLRRARELARVLPQRAVVAEVEEFRNRLAILAKTDLDEVTT